MKRPTRIMLGGALAGMLLATPARAVTLFGLLDTGELYASADQGVTWTIHATLPVRDAVALIASTSSSQLLLASETGSLYGSSDGGVSWAGVAAVPASDVTALGGAASTCLLLTESGSVYRSTDLGVTWTGAGTITAPDLVSVTHLAGAWYALARTGGVHRSADDGAAWTAVGAIATSEAVEIAAYAGKLYAISASGDVYESTDRGASFSAVSTLSQVGTAALVASTAELVAGLETGETAATTSATSWTWRGAINQLRLRALATDIPIALNVAPPGGLALRLRAPWPNPATSVVRLGLDLATESVVTLSVYDLAGREVAKPIATERCAAGSVTREWRPRGLAPGVYTLRATAGGEALTRRLLWLGGR